MQEIDYSLIQEAQKYIDGGNNHRVNTWIFCYEFTRRSGTRKRYEKLLRGFVAKGRLLLASRILLNSHFAEEDHVRIAARNFE
jgi:hypothetical protein